MALPQTEVLETLAWQLDEQIRLHGVMAGLQYMNTFVLPARSISGELLSTAGDRDKLLQLFMCVCEKLNLHSSLALSYFATSTRLESVAEDQVFCHTLQQLHRKSAARFFEYAIEKGEWSFALLILHCRPSVEAWPMLNTLMHHFYREPGSFSVTRIMLKRGPVARQVQCEFLIGSIKVGSQSLYEYIVRHGDISLSSVIEVKQSAERQGGVSYASVLSLIVDSFETLGHTQGPQLKCMLGIAMEAGMSTHHAALTAYHSLENTESPLESAVTQNRVNIVQLLYRTGATTNKELFLVKEFLDDCRLVVVRTGNRVEDRLAEEIYWYVHYASTQPRRLKDLCMLTVSHFIGCRHRRHRVDAVRKILRPAKAPEKDVDNERSHPLEDGLLFRDALLDFKCGSSSHARKRDPPGFWVRRTQH